MKENSYIVTETYSLPSQGKIYSRQVNPEVQLTSMTTRHELLRLSPSEKSYENLAKVLDECIVNDIGISAYDLCMGDFTYLLYKLRAVTYGPELTFIATCPKCGKKHEIKVNIDELEAIEFSDEIDKYRKFTLPKTKHEVELFLRTPRMLDDVLLESAKKTPKGGVNQELIFGISAMVKSIDGNEPDRIVLDWIRDLPMMDTNTILRYAEKLNSSIGVNETAEVFCPNCGNKYTTGVKVGPTFFRPAVNI